MVLKMWEDDYKGRIPLNTEPIRTYTPINDGDEWGDLQSQVRVRRVVPVADELRKYWSSDNEPCEKDDPLLWWNAHRQQYPNLSTMAYDMLAIPPMSDECERTFSSAKHLISDSRNNLIMDIIEASECLKSWFGKPKDGVVTLQQETEAEKATDLALTTAEKEAAKVARDFKEQEDEAEKVVKYAERLKELDNIEDLAKEAKAQAFAASAAAAIEAGQPVDDIVNSSDFEDEDLDVDSDGEVMVLDI
jgi:hypothetical protein